MSAADQSPSDEAIAPVPSYRGLKIAVIVMGVLLVAGIIVVFSTIIYRSVKLGDEPVKSVRAAGEPYELDALIPPGAATGAMTLADDRLAVEVLTAQGSYILLFDVRRGRELGRINLTKQ